MKKKILIIILLIASVLFTGCDIPKDCNGDYYSYTVDKNVIYEKVLSDYTCNELKLYVEYNQMPTEKKVYEVEYHIWNESSCNYNIDPNRGKGWSKTAIDRYKVINYIIENCAQENGRGTDNDK